MTKPVEMRDYRAMIETDADFYLRRERQERLLADRTPDDTIAALHRQMADHYAGLIRRKSTVRSDGLLRPSPIVARVS